MSTSPGISIQRTWSCHCGCVQAKLLNDSTPGCFRCHCHSCVAAAKYIAKATDDKPSMIPMLHADGGACVSPYAAENVEFTTGLSDTDGNSMLKFVKVGEEGSAWRCSTTCCGTQMTNCVFPGWIAFNRNGIKNEDGSKYDPEIINVFKSCSFDPKSVPEPSHETLPDGWFDVFMTKATGSTKLKDLYPELFPKEADITDIVPITW
ncbi:expressed unknown protein [Seminavis robusta]|uniref:CENP-V/GFA domain-containing protein n=1 Tax=Seminavis robusta TaxID=568900 RepID=A0A9N8EWY1_9STRA|nr:expressed unknown protein [Seminavis robusta]|eukprot:Sro1798_g298260.1 n/a (206) ;mRNA; r:9119-9736